MIALVEGAERQKTPNEIALNILLAGMTIIFVFAVATIPSFATYAGGKMSVLVLVALFVTLIPTTIGALLSAIGIAGMDRLVRFNVLAMSGRAVEAAGDVDTLAARQDRHHHLGQSPGDRVSGRCRASTSRIWRDAAQLSSLSDETPEGRSIVVLAKEKYGIRGREMAPLHAKFIPFSAQTRISGIDVEGTSIRKGAVDAVLDYALAAAGMAKVQGPDQAAAVKLLGPEAGNAFIAISERIAKTGGTPLAVGEGRQAARRHSPQGYRQGRHPRALRGAAQDGHPHRDDHRRQSADGGGHRGGVGRRRFPRPGDARKPSSS